MKALNAASILPEDGTQGTLVGRVWLPSASGGMIAAWLADVVTGVRTSLASNNFAAADSELAAYRAQHGVDPEYLEALSWEARAALSSNRLEPAEAYAKQIQTLARPLLQKRPLDAEPHLPAALGAAVTTSTP